MCCPSPADPPPVLADVTPVSSLSVVESQSRPIGLAGASSHSSASVRERERRNTTSARV
jgi:hypothetical protein